MRQLRQGLAAHIITPQPYDNPPDIGLAVDIGRKAFEDCLATIVRNMNLTPGPIEAGIAEMVALAALVAHAKDRETDMPEEIKSAWTLISSVFNKSEAELLAALEEERSKP